VIEISVQVVDHALDGLIYDMELYFGDQSPSWQGAQPLQWPAGWNPVPIAAGIGFRTETAPLTPAAASRIVIQVVPPAAGNTIWIALTGRDHRILGYIVSQRT